MADEEKQEEKEVDIRFEHIPAIFFDMYRIHSKAADALEEISKTLKEIKDNKKEERID